MNKTEEEEERSKTYDKQTEVYFYEGDESEYFCLLGDPDDEGKKNWELLVLEETILERLEAQHGDQYQRAVNPHEHVYTGTLKYDSTALSKHGNSDIPDTAWTFNQLNHHDLDTDLNGLTYEQEGGIEGNRIASPVDILETARDLEVGTEALFGVVDNYERRYDIDRHSEPKINDVFVYWNGIAIVELTQPIEHVHGGNQEYALVDFNGYVFPFDPVDVEYIAENVKEAGLQGDNEHA